jgi:hypothetical protein
MLRICNILTEPAKLFLSKYHYLGSKPFRKSYIYGLYDGELVGVCVFHLISAPETAVGAFGLSRNDQTGLYELGRLAVHPSLNGGNNTSWFVSRSIKQLRKDTKVRAIISYADSSAGHIGSIYRACNALYCGMTSPKKDYYVNGKIQERGKTKGVGGEWKPRPRKHRYVWLFDPTLHLKWKVESCNYKGVSKDILNSIEI